MLTVEWTTSNYAMLDDGKHSYTLVYSEDRLRKYSEFFHYPNWTMDKVLNELRDDIEIELLLAFPREPEDNVKNVALQLMPYASANIHDPRTNK